MEGYQYLLEDEHGHQAEERVLPALLLLARRPLNHLVDGLPVGEHPPAIRGRASQVPATAQGVR